MSQLITPEQFEKYLDDLETDFLRRTNRIAMLLNSFASVFDNLRESYKSLMEMRNIVEQANINEAKKEKE